MTCVRPATYSSAQCKTKSITERLQRTGLQETRKSTAPRRNWQHNREACPLSYTCGRQVLLAHPAAVGQGRPHDLLDRLCYHVHLCRGLPLRVAICGICEAVPSVWPSRSHLTCTKEVAASPQRHSLRGSSAGGPCHHLVAACPAPKALPTRLLGRRLAVAVMTTRGTDRVPAVATAD